jgi:hypothetical protein
MHTPTFQNDLPTPLETIVVIKYAVLLFSLAVPFRLNQPGSRFMIFNIYPTRVQGA